MLFIVSFLYSCSDSITNQSSNISTSYKKVYSVDSAGINFEIWKLGDSILLSGYNDIGFKVFINGNEKKSGFVKFTPLMYHTGGISHSTPVSEYYFYDNQKSLFTGYVCLLMASDSNSSWWYADYNYNDENIIKKNLFYVYQAKDFQMRFWVDINTMISYSLSIISPKDNLVQGTNEFKCILHRKDERENYVEVDSAEMFLNISKIQDNMNLKMQNPVWIGRGKYLGNVDFPSSGKWAVSDTVKLNGNYITGNSPPKFFFDLQ